MAFFINFPEANKSLGPPSDMTAETCGTLAVHTDGTTCISCWRPTPQELAELNAGGSLWLGIRSGMSQPAVFLTAFQPEFAKPDTTLTKEVDAALATFAQRLPHPDYHGLRPMTGEELRRHNPDLLRIDGGLMDEHTLYFVSSIDIQLAHLIRMRRAFQDGGQPAVVAYLKPYREFLHSPETQPVY